MPVLKVIQGRRDELERRVIEALFAPRPYSEAEFEALTSPLKRRGRVKAVCSEDDPARSEPESLHRSI
jgi:hypothetical protein